MKKTDFKEQQQSNSSISYIDDLWQRVGNKLKSRGVKRKDIKSQICEVRTVKKTASK
jgi:hypothetical protein